MELADVTDSKSVDGDIVWVRVPPPAPTKRESHQRFLFCLFGTHEWDSKDERHRATVRWTVVTASDQAPAGARIESHHRHQQKGNRVSGSFFCLFGTHEWGSKDERHRATVRWTVVTASDQAAAGARIESHHWHQKKALLRKCFFQRNPPFGWVKYCYAM